MTARYSSRRPCAFTTSLDATSVDSSGTPTSSALASPTTSPNVTEAPALGRKYATVIAREAWRAVGAEGEPTKWVIDFFALHISGFATYAHLEQSAQQTGALSARLRWLVLQEAFRELAWSAD